MSVKTMGLVWDLDNSMIDREEKYVLLAYADHADHSGSNIFPSIELICQKTGYKERAAQMITKSLVNKGFLIPDGKGPKGTNRYRYGGGAKNAGVQEAAKGGASSTVDGGALANAPEPSKPSVEPSSVSLTNGEMQQAGEKVDKYFELLSKGQGNGWTGREMFAPAHLPLVDWYHQVTGQDCPKKKQADWMKAVNAWSANGLTLDDLKAAYAMDIKWRGVFMSPNQLTEKAIALKAQRGILPSNSSGRALTRLGERDL